MEIALRAASEHDFAFCERLYCDGMKAFLVELNLDAAREAESLRQQWAPKRARIIVLDNNDVGWVQTATRAGTYFVAQLFIQDVFQGRGIGTQVMRRLIAEALHNKQTVTLGVFKINPAVRFYEKLGFSITREDDHRFYMTLDPTVGPPTSA